MQKIIIPSNVNRLEVRQVLTGPKKQVKSVAFAPDGQILASGSSGYWFGGDSAVWLWRVADGQLVQTLIDYTGSVLSLAFSSDGQLLASGSDDKTVRLWYVA